MRRRWQRALLALGTLLGALLLLTLRGERGPSPAAPPPPAAVARPSRELPIRLVPTRPPPAADRLPASFEGRIVDAETLAGIPGAELTFSRGGVADSVRADARGAFRFLPPAPGRWQLAAVTGEGHLPFAPEWGLSPVQLDAVPGKHVRGIEIHLAPAALLVGRVVDEDGLPVPGAEVRLLGAQGRAALVPIPDRFVTNGEGQFRAAAPEGAALEARKAGYYPGRARVDAFAALEGRVEIQLGPAWSGFAPGTATLTGAVQAGGRPVAGALVELRRQRSWSEAPAVAQTVTGADGRFRFAELADAPYGLLARADGHRAATLDEVLPGRREAILELSAGGTLRGCVRSGVDGAPVAPFTLQVFEATAKQNLDVPDRTISVIDPSGCYALDDLAPGPTRLLISAAGFAPDNGLTAHVAAPPAEPAVADAVLQPGGALFGVVLDARTGAPLPGARVRAAAASLGVEWSPRPRAVVEAVTGEQGRFRLPGLPARVNVTALAAGYAVQPVGGQDVAPGGDAGPLEIRLRRLAPGEATPATLAGIGAVLSPEGDALGVAGVRPGSAAAEVGLGPGDQIVEIDGRPVAQLGAGGAAEALRGPVGTPVYLQIRRSGSVATLEVRRRPLTPPR